MDEEPNIEQVKLTSLTLLKSIEGLKQRKVVEAIMASLKGRLRLKLLRGFRGVGKTTAMLQAFGHDTTKSLYFSADSPPIKKWGIYNTSVAALKQGYSLLFIDEVHTYPHWRDEIKSLHDENPHLRVVASGSAPLALVPERREELTCLHPMDLGEFIFLKDSRVLDSVEVWKNKEKTMEFIASTPNIEADFYKYTRTGGFPLSLGLEEDKSLNAIYYSIKKSIREDAVFFLKMSKEKIFAMENLLNFLATSKPGELSINSLSSSLGISKTVVYEIVDALEGMEIIRMIRPFAGGGALARAEPKILFFHPNMRFAVCAQLGRTPEKGAVREELAVFGFKQRGWSVHTLKGEKKSPDYLIEKGKDRLVVEIGGEVKTKMPLKGYENAFLINEYQLIPLLIVAKSTKID